MDRFRSLRRVQVQPAEPPPPPQPATVDEGEAEEAAPQWEDDSVGGDGGLKKVRSPERAASGDLEPFMGIKVRRRASLHRDCKGDYLDVPSYPYLVKIMSKQGDSKVLFADKVLKFTGSGKMKRRILLITECAIYLVDPETDVLKRRVAIAAFDKLCLSELNDNFFAIIIPSEYDILMASTRKSEIVTVLVEAIKSKCEYDLDVNFSNRFEYNAAADLIKEILFEEADGGGVRTKITRKKGQ